MSNVVQFRPKPKAPEPSWDEYKRLMEVFETSEDPREAADAYMAAERMKRQLA